MKKSTQRKILRAASCLLPFLALLQIFLVRNYLSVDGKMEDDAEYFVIAVLAASVILMWSTFYITRNWREV